MTHYNIRLNIIYAVILLLLSSLSATAQNDSINMHSNDSIMNANEIEKRLKDSIQMEDLKLQIQQLQLKNIVYQTKLESRGHEDSLKLSKQKARIDSLRNTTKGAPLIIEGDTLLSLYANRGGALPQDRVEQAKKIILAAGKKFTTKPDSVSVYDSDYTTDVMANHRVVLSLTDNDGLWNNTSRQELAKEYAKKIDKQINALHKKYGIQQRIKHVLLFILLISVEVLLIYLINKLFKVIKKRIQTYTLSKLKPLSIKNFQLLDLDKMEKAIWFLVTTVKLLLIFVTLVIAVPLLFDIFPETKVYAENIFNFLWTPSKDVLISVRSFLPSLFKIIVIIIFFRYLVKALRFVAREIKSKKLKLSGFYPDWAMPTFNILRFLIYVFMLIIIWPLLPHSQSPVFKGISVFVGVLLSLGSTSVMGNWIAGFVITYMRPFRVGDQIKLGETIGTVLEKTAFVTRIKTLKNEIITIPNSFILSSHTINYTMSAEKFGLIVHAYVNVGYDVPVKKVEELLIECALNCPGTVQVPKPFVYVSKLEDAYIEYEINVYTKEPKLSKIYSDLYSVIIQKFDQAGIVLLSPHILTINDNVTDITLTKKETAENDANTASDKNTVANDSGKTAETNQDSMSDKNTENDNKDETKENK